MEILVDEDETDELVVALVDELEATDDEELLELEIVV